MGASDEAVWFALSDQTRRKILDVLKAGPRTTGAICSQFPVSRTAVMKHLDVLGDARLITFRRAGRERWNYINAAPLRRIYERWLTPFQQLWAASLTRLGTIVEGNRLMTPSESPSLSHSAITHEVELAAPAARVFEALTKKISNWWSHVTYEADSKPDLRLEAAAGGRFYETSGENQRLYAIVTRYEPGAHLWLEGAMGISGCVFGTVTFNLKSTGGSATTLTMSHDVIGILNEETISMYRGGWNSLLDDGLKPFVETGREAWSVA
jgi:uncharacterized protein YndB with AHSA1/START domain/DNA-binding transcriptional ArsR family regulator